MIYTCPEEETIEGNYTKFYSKMGHIPKHRDRNNMS